MLPTYDECYPLVLLEAMQHGLPCISTNVGGISSIIEEGKTGLIVEERNAQALEDAMVRLYEDEELRKEMGKWGFIPKVLFTSDGTKIITGKDAWLKKMQIRWNNAPIIQDWEKRIVGSNPQLLSNEGYMQARGRISCNLTYCHILSNREEVGRQETLKYGKEFRKDSWGKLMNWCKHTKFTWWLLSKVIQYREYHR